MKKINIFVLVILTLAIFTSLFKAFDPVNVQASSATTYTYTFDKKGNGVRTQDAYLPKETLRVFKYGDSSITIKNPNDIFVDDQDYIYLVDTGNKRIVKYDTVNKEVVLLIENGGVGYTFSNPIGVFVSSEAQGRQIYVSDSSAKSVFVFNADGTFDRKYTKPNHILFLTGFEMAQNNGYEGTKDEWEAENPTNTKTALAFEPQKVAVDSANNIYLVCTGVTEGIVKLSEKGEFMGFFTTNYVNLTLMQRIENIFYSDNDVNAGIVTSRRALQFSNVYVDRDGWVYTTTVTPTNSRGINTIQKHKSDGTNLFSFLSNTRDNDVFVDKNGIVYVSESIGTIDLYTSDGELIFWFGATSSESVSGFFNTLTGLAVTSDGTIYAIDSTNSYVQSFIPTDYTNEIFKAITQYNTSDYLGAVETWTEVLNRNQMSVIAHNGIAKCYLMLSANDESYYELAAEHFELAGNRANYSEVFWELRNISIQENIVWAIIALVGLVIIWFIIKKLNKKYHFLDPIGRGIKKFFSIRKVNDVFYGLNVIKHPLDSMYKLKKKEKGSYLGATVILLIGFISYMVYSLGKGFIFQLTEAIDMDIWALSLGFFLIIFMFILANWLVTSIKDGEGTLGQIYKGVCYSLYPFIIGALLTTLLSHVFSNDEAFILNLLWYISLGFTLLLVYLSIQELQNYSIGKTIVSILISVLFIMLIVVLFTFVQMICSELINFIVEIIKEAVRNVFS